MTASRRSVRLPRGAVIALAVAGAALLAALLAGPPRRDGPPLDPRSDGPLGTSALVALLRHFDAEVELDSGLPDGQDDVALLLQDRLDEEQIAAVEAWVRAGGTLVVTDPGSSLAPLPATGGSPLGPPALERGTCTVDALADVGTLDGGAPVRYEVGEADELCFGSRPDGAFVVVAQEGGGEVVAVGGAAFATNDRLGEDDNAVLAVALLAPEPGMRVRVVDAPLPAGGGDKTLADLVPGGVKRALLQLALAFVAYAVWRAVRLGRPVTEDQLVQLAGSELVSATGRLRSRSRAPAASAAELREDLRRRLRTRFGVHPEADAATLAALVARRTGLADEAVLAAVDDRPVTTDDDLVALTRAVAVLNQEVPR